MIPGEVFVQPGEIVLNEGRQTITLRVANTGDRPIQVGSPYHFYEPNEALYFDRDAAEYFDERKEGLPPRYHANSELTAEVSAKQTKFDFDLKSK